jgi:hypothetical protein
LRQTIRESRAKEAEKLRQHSQHVVELLRRRGELPEFCGTGQRDDYPLAILPANQWKLGPLPQERRKALAEKLPPLIEKAMAADAEADPPDSATASDADADSDPDELAVLGHACATCRGWCCQGGGEHAYLDERTFRTYKAQHPDKDADQIMADYLSYLPEVSYEGSCVYHTDIGCALPRDMRSDVSRWFLCAGLKDLQGRLPSEGPRRAFAAAFDNETLVRITMIDPSQVRVIYEPQ